MKRVSAANEPAERREPAKRRASDAVGESEGRRPSEKEERRLALWPWLVGAAALVFLAERGLALLRGAA